MGVKPIPDGYTAVTPLLIVDDGEGLMRFTKQVFDATEHQVARAPDGKIWHADLLIGGAHLMVGTANERFPATRSVVQLYVPDVDATYRRALEAGATSVADPSNAFYGDRGGGVRDSSGTVWWISTHVEDVPPEELKRREAEAVKRQQH